MRNISQDFSLPIRLGYYRNLSPFLMSRFDDYKRYYLVTNQKACYENTVKNFSNPEVTMLYCNMGLSYTSTLRPLARNLSTESVIASFFRELITLESGSLSEKYDRIFSVMAHSINDPNASLLQQFVAGYLEAYPKYASSTLKAYKNSTGYDYSEVAIPEIWIANLCGCPIMLHLFYKLNLVFLVFILIYSLLLYYLKWLPTKKVLLLIKQYFKWYGFTFIGLSVCFLSSVLVIHNTILPILPTYILIILLCELLFFLILHKRPLDYKRHLLSSSIMFLLILYSLI